VDTNQIIAWSVAVAALAFVVLCGFLISLLRTAERSLAAAQSALQEVKSTVDGLHGEVRKLAGSVNEVASDVKGKLQSTDPLFHAVQDVGIILREVTGTAREATKSLSASLRKQAEATSRHGPAHPAWLKWVTLGSRIATAVRHGGKSGKEPSFAAAKEGI